MPNLPPRACGVCRTTFTGSQCPTCAAKRYAERNDDATRKLYNRAVWHRFRTLVLSANPLCQALETDWQSDKPTQCRHGATEVHHLVSPRDNPGLMLTPANVVALCRHHHHKQQGEASGRREPGKFVPTLWLSNPLGGTYQAVN